MGGGVDGGQTGRVTWSSWMSCGMASRIWTAIFTTFRGGAMVQPGQGPCTFQAVQPPAKGAPGLGPLGEEGVPLSAAWPPWPKLTAQASTPGQAPRPSQGSRS